MAAPTLLPRLAVALALLVAAVPSAGMSPPCASLTLAIDRILLFPFFAFRFFRFPFLLLYQESSSS
jgi:hypothetical protein